MGEESCARKAALRPSSRRIAYSQAHKSHLLPPMSCPRFPDKLWEAEGLVMRHCR